MGVKGLQYYVEQHCPQACVTVSIRDLARRHQNDVCNSTPVLVVDGMAVLRKLYEPTLEWVYGGQWCQFLEVLSDFIARFRSIGIKLVFFFDGTICASKRQEWVSRRVKKYKEVASIFRFIKRSGQHPDPKLFQLPASMGTLTRFALKFVCGAEVYTTTREADQEVAMYARENSDVFAILSQDTDFLIYDTKYYLSATHLNLDSLTTVLYDRQRLATSLSLRITQLPLFSCLLGNDVIASEELKTFHRSICRNSDNRNPSVDQIIPHISNLIRSNRWNGDYRYDQELIPIAKTVFGDMRAAEYLRKGLMTYCLARYSETSQFDGAIQIVKEFHIKCLNSPTIYNILEKLEYESSTLLEDFDDRSLPPAALVYRPVRRRTYFLLFGCLESQLGRTIGRVTVKEWCAYAGNMMNEPDMVKPLPIEIPGGNCLPALERMWQDLPELQDLKIQCFLACLGIPLHLDQLRRVSRHHIVLCCILNYLLVYRPPLLAPWEVAAFIAQAVSPKNRNLKLLSELQIQKINSRGVHLASLFMRGVATVDMILSTCGYPFSVTESMPWNYFDGKLFHYMYIQAKNGSHVEELCDKQVTVIEEFYNLLSVVTYGTPLAGTKLFEQGP